MIDDATIRHLAEIANLPASADLNAFTAGIREAAGIYVSEAVKANANEQHDEIAELYFAADRRQYARLAGLLDLT